MSNPKGKPIEKPPTGLRLPRFWYAKQNYGIPYRPKDKPVQEDWGSVARKFGVGVQELIFFNFLTNDSAEVNWYLSHYTGCNKVSPSGNNWMFSNSASPGIIYIPPLENRDVTYEPEVECIMVPDKIEQFMKRLRVISQSMSGNRGARIQKLVEVILRVGFPGCLDLWYYNDMNMTAYFDILMDGAKLRDMTKATQGAFPFDGPSGLHRQSSTPEQSAGMWRIHAVRDLFDQFACGAWDAADLQDSLVDIDDLMYHGWHQGQLMDRTQTGGGSTYDQQAWDFRDHVTYLTKDDNHLYSALRP